MTDNEREQVARFGPAAEPDYDDDGSPSQRYTAFLYVLQVATMDKIWKDDRELYRCLLAALQNGDGSVFRHIADAVEAVGKVLKGEKKAHLPYAWAALEAKREEKDFLRKNPLLASMGHDPRPTVSEVLEKMGKDPSSDSEKRQIRRAKAALGVELKPDKSGPKKKSPDTRRG